MATPYAPARLERTVALTPKGRAVLALIRRQDALPADDDAGRAAIEHQLDELLRGSAAERRGGEGIRRRRGAPAPNDPSTRPARLADE